MERNVRGQKDTAGFVSSSIEATLAIGNDEWVTWLPRFVMYLLYIFSTHLKRSNFMSSAAQLKIYA